LDLTRGYFEGYCYGDEWRLWLGQKQAVIRQNRSVSCFNEQAYSLYTVFAIVSLKKWPAFVIKRTQFVQTFATALEN